MVTVLPVATDASANAPTADEVLSVTVSFVSTPTRAAEEVVSAAVVVPL